AFLDPFHDETVGREQSQQAGRFLRLKGTDPGVEVLFRHLVTQRVHAALPKSFAHPPALAFLCSPKGGRVYSRWVKLSTGAALPDNRRRSGFFVARQSLGT